MQELSYDPWGRLRNPATQTAYAPGSEPTPYLGRGYTGHKHLTQFGLINMNARLYDPALGRFLSPDPYVQAPDNTQNFNRYSYCLNNPLRYTDESGELFGIDDAILIGIGVGLVAGGYTGYKIADAKGYNWSDGQMYGYIAGGAVVGGLAGWAGASLATSISASVLAGGGTALEAATISGGMAGMAAGGINGAGMTALAGGNMNDIIAGMIQGGMVGGFSGAIGSLTFQATNSLLQNAHISYYLKHSIKLPFLTANDSWKLLTFDKATIDLSSLIPVQTLSYMAGSTASQMVANLVMGNRLFENVDYGLNIGLLLPLSLDVIKYTNCMDSYYKNRLEKIRNTDVNIEDVDSKMDIYGDYQSIINYTTQTPCPASTGQNPLLNELFSHLFDTNFYTTDAYFPHYRDYVLMNHYLLNLYK